MKHLTLISLLLALCGCTSVSRQTQTRVKFRAGDVVVEVVSPKDTEAKEIVFDPTTRQIRIIGLRSTVNAGAVEAGVAARTADLAGLASVVSDFRAISMKAIEAYEQKPKP